MTINEVEIKLELSLKEIRRNAESICPRSNFIMFLVVVFILKFTLKQWFQTDAIAHFKAYTLQSAGDD